MIKDKYFRVCLVVTIVLLLAVFAGCDTVESNTKKNVQIVLGERIGTITYDSCEYVTFAKGITHKGNCKFCKERK